MAEKLTKAQAKALMWIENFPCHQAEWRTGSRPAQGAPEKWDRMRLSGAEGSIVVMADDWKALFPMLEPAPFGTAGKIYTLTPAGRLALENTDDR